MFDTHKQLNVFYDEHVRLGSVRRAELEERRDSCLERLKEGLVRLSEERRRSYPGFVRTYTQGSCAMHTLNQHPKGDYDIDVAVVFKSEDLPSSPLRARQRVADALRSTLNNFATKPRARTNAVTVWYTKGHHVDLAIYRETTDFLGHSCLEHAGSEWRRREPMEVNNWFAQRVKELSPDESSGATVQPGQFRRVVRLVKAFARSRVSWKLPGGMILSALVSEVYQSHLHRDDVALVETLFAMRLRLMGSLEVRSPVSPGSILTRKPEIAAQMRRLLQKLEYVLPMTESLRATSCQEFQAMKAWYRVFRHAYWLERAMQLDAPVASIC